MVNKAELIDVLTEKLGTDRRHATAAVENFVDTVVRAVQKGESVTITGFGVFEQRRRAARVARNPRTGETVKVKPTSVPAFRPGAQFKAVVSGAQRLPSEGPAVKRGVVASGGAKKVAKKSPAKKAAVKKTVSKAPAKKAAVKAAVKKAPAKKAVTKKAPAKKATKVAKTVAKRVTKAVKKAPVKKAVTKRAPAKKAPAKKAATRRGRR
jgi:DNA-binding protein HU-beta